MPNTKIINVLRNDTFDDVFNAFLGVEAQEVIFIMPRGSRLVRNHRYFEMIKTEAESSGKTVSVMTADPIIASYANQYNLNLLHQNAKSTAKQSETAVDEENEIPDAPVSTTQFQSTELASKNTKSMEVKATLTSQGLHELTDENDEPVFAPFEDEVDNQTFNDNDEEDLIPTSADTPEEDLNETEDEIEQGSELTSVEQAYTDRPIADLAFATLKKKTLTRKVRKPITVKNEDRSVQTAPNESSVSTSYNSPYAQAPVQTTPDLYAPQRPAPQNVFDILPSSGEIQSGKNGHMGMSPEPSNYSESTIITKDKESALSNLWMSRPQPNEKLGTPSLRANVSSQGPLNTSMRKIGYMIGMFTVLCVVALGIYTYYGTAKIIIQPKHQDLNVEIHVTASTDTTSADTTFNKIPGTYIEASTESSATQEATGQRDSAAKASGMVTIYNTTSATQKFIATTRFASPEGYIFRIDQSISVPGGSKNSPGTANAKVFADKAGVEYNIAPARFNLPGLKGTPRFDQFYAISTKAFSGGSVGPAKVATLDDIQRAIDNASKDIDNKIKSSIQVKDPDLTFITFSKPVITKKQLSAEEDQVTNTIEAKIEARGSSMGIKSSDIKQLILAKATSDSDSLAIKEDSLKISYQDPTYDETTKTLSFILKASGVAYTPLDKEKILGDILGMPEATIQAYLKNRKDVESAQIIFSPFWLQSIPKIKDQVQVDVQI